MGMAREKDAGSVNSSAICETKGRYYRAAQCAPAAEASLFSSLLGPSPRPRVACAIRGPYQPLDTVPVANGPASKSHFTDQINAVVTAVVEADILAPRTAALVVVGRHRRGRRAGPRLLHLGSLAQRDGQTSTTRPPAKSGGISWKALVLWALSTRVRSSPWTSFPPRFGSKAFSVRIFGFSSWSMLLPEALAGVASVLILYKLVRRWQGDIAGLLAALALAVTPVAVLMFRYNNPRCPPDPPAASGGLGALVGNGEGVHMEARGLWGAGRARLSHQDA